MTDQPKSKASRDPIKREFLATLTEHDRTYLLKNHTSSPRYWAKEPLAREIVTKAREAGVYQKKTIAMDVLSGLVNFLRRA